MEQALSVAVEVAGRLLRTPDSEVDVDAGCGIALLCDELDRVQPGRGWAAAAHGKLAKAVRTVETTSWSGLFGGVAGVAFAAWRLSRDGTRYQRLLGQVDSWIAAMAVENGRELAANPSGRASTVFDLIFGLSGTGAYLLSRKDPALEAVLDGLVAFCGEQDGSPNWYTPSELLVKGSPLARRFPRGGALNCGLAHGIPGPLAVLSLAMDDGFCVPGQREAIERVATWLDAQRADDEWGPNWPPAVPIPGAEDEFCGPTHSAWCYGAPGVARSLWFAGKALRDDKMQRLAVETMKAACRRTPEARGIDYSSVICHGIAGLLLNVLRFAHDTGDPEFTDAANDLAGQLVGMYDPATAYGYRAMDASGELADDPGLLDGAAGVALTLLAAATETQPAWDRLFLLS